MGVYFSTVWGLNLLQNKHTHKREKNKPNWKNNQKIILFAFLKGLVQFSQLGRS